MPRKSIHSGFTLIELLIVVAIIAILAAIAVPNFLEAQTRSKVSRCKADMRSIATALEAYAVDHNHYPTFHYTTYQQGSYPVTHFFLGGYFDQAFDGNPQITTPVAYITSIPHDPFFKPGSGNPPDVYQFLYTNFEFYAILNPSGADWALRLYGRWRLSSGGPDMSRGDIGAVPGDSWHILYDPTNGTVSPGQIHRTELSPDGIPRL